MVEMVIMVVLFVLLIIVAWRTSNLRDDFQKERWEHQAAMSKLLSQKKSSEVRTGFIAEHLAPFLKGFPVDVMRKDVDIVPMGNPMDYMIFTPTKVIMVEIKSGKARLSKKQRTFQKLAEGSDVLDFHLMRIDPESEEEESG